MKKAVFTGSFDPITKGHEALVLQALPLFDEIIGRAETYLNYNVGIDGLHCDYIRFGGTASQHNFPDDGITATGAITEFSRQFSAAAKKIKPSALPLIFETKP